MSDDKHDTETLERRLKAGLDEHAERLDLRTQMRLAAAREAALNPRRAKPRPKPWLWAVPLATAAGVAVLSLNLHWRATVPPEGLLLEDLEMLSASEPTEFYEDLEFYAWLPEGGNAGTGS